MDSTKECDHQWLPYEYEFPSIYLGISLRNEAILKVIYCPKCYKKKIVKEEK